ncbi:MAG: tRNA (adenosine(37)-N6)-threonylcarbamoyltransferase complex transferase subunit TsaD [Candidatus Paceibacterota bacterium]
MLILGIETSCDETSASLLEVKNGSTRVLSNVISSQIKIHAKFGGVVPSLAAREHVKNLGAVLKLALQKYDFDGIDLIAITAGPGLVSSLLVGTAFAKTIAWKFSKKIVAINHMEGHIYSNWLGSVGKKKAMDKQLFPAICLTVSGGHTQLILMKKHSKYRLLGETLDDAAGEAFDKIARMLELPYPGGPSISKAAEKVIARKYSVVLPRPMIGSKNFNFSFAGLKTAVLYLLKDMSKKYPLTKIRNEVAAEAQQAIVDVLVSKTIRAVEKYKVKSIMLSGGVSANKLLREELKKTSKQKGLKYFQPEMEYTTDNAAMIAMAGYFNRKSKKQGLKKIQANANWEIV